MKLLKIVVAGVKISAVVGGVKSGVTGLSFCIRRYSRKARHWSRSYESNVEQWVTAPSRDHHPRQSYLARPELNEDRNHTDQQHQGQRRTERLADITRRHHYIHCGPLAKCTKYQRQKHHRQERYEYDQEHAPNSRHVVLPDLYHEERQQPKHRRPREVNI